MTILLLCFKIEKRRCCILFSDHSDTWRRTKKWKNRSKITSSSHFLYFTNISFIGSKTVRRSTDASGTIWNKKIRSSYGSITSSDGIELPYGMHYPSQLVS